jgi:hypothetical protein
MIEPGGVMNVAEGLPPKSRGKAIQKVFSGPSNVCGNFTNSYTIVPGDQPGMGELRRDFGRGLKDTQSQVFYDPTARVAAFADDSNQFDAFTIVGLPEGGKRPGGFLLEGPDASIDKEEILGNLRELQLRGGDNWSGEGWRSQFPSHRRGLHKHGLERLCLEH